jgi:hypothetical protein
MKIDIYNNFRDLDDMMHELGNDVTKAVRASLNTATRRGRVQGSKEIRRRINMPPAEIRKRITFIKAKGGSLRNLETQLIFSGTPIGMINFIVGSKQAIKQAGVKLKKRRKVKARIKAGKTFRLEGAFIQNITSKQVFRHEGKGRRARKLSTKSLAKIVFEDKINKMLDNIVFTKFNREFPKQIRWRWDKTGNKFSKSPMRLPK